MALVEAFSKTADVVDNIKSEEKYKEIKPETDITDKEVKDFWNNLFNDMEQEGNSGEEIAENKLEKVLEDYRGDLKENSEFKDTLPDKPFEASDLEKVSPEENAMKREEFNAKKENLIQQWEEKIGCSWPTYKENVYITNSRGDVVQIREAGMRYDAHHIQPLGLGGKNEVGNITPLRAEVHFDHFGVHAIGGPNDKMEKMLGGISDD